jgi:hypothetical protein
MMCRRWILQKIHLDTNYLPRTIFFFRGNENLMCFKIFPFWLHLQLDEYEYLLSHTPIWYGDIWYTWSRVAYPLWNHVNCPVHFHLTRLSCFWLTVKINCQGRSTVHTLASNYAFFYHTLNRIDRHPKPTTFGNEILEKRQTHTLWCGMWIAPIVESLSVKFFFHIFCSVFQHSISKNLAITVPFEWCCLFLWTWSKGVERNIFVIKQRLTRYFRDAHKSLKGKKCAR